MMGGVLPPVVAHLVADISEFSAGMGAAASEVKALEARGSSTMSKLGTIGKAAFLGLAAAALVVGGASIHMASGFDAVMERVHTQAGASQAEVDSLKDKVLAMGYATGQGPEKLAEALYHVESVGYRGATAMAVLDNAAKLATISGANLDDTTYGLTSVMQTYGAKAQDAAKWAAFFNGVVGVGDMKMEAFNRAVGTGFFSTAQTFGVSAQSAGAALAFMTDRGAHADEAATRLRMTIALIAAPSAKASGLLRDIGLSGDAVKASTHAMTEALKKSGLTTVSLANDLMKPDGLYVALHHLQDALKKSGLSASAANALLSHAFGGGKSDATILAMLNNLDTLKSKYGMLGHSVHSYADSWKSASDQFQTKVHQMEAGAEGLGIKLGNYLIPQVTKLVSWVMQAVDWMGKHQTLVKELAAAIGGVLLVAIGAWVVALGQAAVANIAATWEILVIIAALAALVFGIMWLKDHWGQVWGWVTDKAHAVASAVSDAWSKVVSWTSQKWGQVENSVKGAWHSIASWIAGAWHTVTDPIVAGWHWLEGVTHTVWDGISGWFKKWWPLLLAIFLPPVFIMLALWNHFHQQVWDTVVAVWGAVSGWLHKTWDSVSADAKVAWEWVYRHVIEPIQRAWRMVELVGSSIWASITRSWNQVVSTTHSLWSRIYSTIVGWLNAILRPVGQFATSVWNTITGAFHSVLSWLSGVGSWFYGIGAAIVHGIISGISGAGGALFSSLSGLANSALSAAKSALGINSPSKVFAAVVGHAIPEGIALGVQQKASLAHQAVSTMTGALPGSSVSPYATSAAAGGGSGTHTINLTLISEAKVDGDVLFRTQQQKALRYQKRNGRQAFTLTPGIA